MDQADKFGKIGELDCLKTIYQDGSLKKLDQVCSPVFELKRCSHQQQAH